MSAEGLSVPAEMTVCSKLFHAPGPATAKARVPTVDSLAGGAMRGWWQQSTEFVNYGIINRSTEYSGNAQA